jgi:hypothetical protein
MNHDAFYELLGAMRNGAEVAVTIDKGADSKHYEQ